MLYEKKAQVNHRHKNQQKQKSYISKINTFLAKLF